jgi:hypothetical protein
MSAVPRLLAAVLVTATLSLLAGEVAHAAATPPAGVPDPSGMTVQPGDLPAGTTVDSAGYVDLPGASGAYDRVFLLPAGAGVELIDSSVGLQRSVAAATSTYNATYQGFRTKARRRAFGNSLAGSIGARKASVRVGPPHRFAAGDAAFTIALRIQVHRTRTRMVFAMVRVDRALGMLTVVGRRGSTTMRQTERYLQANALHLRTGLSPQSVVAPSIGGTPAVGTTLQAVPGTWADETKPTGFLYQWQRCDAAGAACVAIPGATGSSYVLTPADAGATIRIAVTATNSAGSTEADSAPTPLVA